MEFTPSPVSNRPPFCIANDNDMEKLRKSLKQLNSNIQDAAAKLELEKLQTLIEKFYEEKKKTVDPLEKKIEDMKNKTVKIGQNEYSYYDLLRADVAMFGIIHAQCVASQKISPIRHFFLPSTIKKQCEQAKALRDFFVENAELNKVQIAQIESSSKIFLIIGRPSTNWRKFPNL